MNIPFGVLTAATLKYSPTFISASTATTFLGNATSVTINYPTGILTGDTLIILLSIQQTSFTTLTPPSGWTLFGGVSRFGSMYKMVTTGSETGTTTVSFTTAISNSSYAGGMATMILVRGANPNGIPQVANGGDAVSQTANAPSLTPYTGSSLLICWSNEFTATSGATCTVNNGLTLKLDTTVSSVGAGTYKSLAVATKALTSSSATGITSFVWSGSAYESVASSILIS